MGSVTSNIFSVHTIVALLYSCLKLLLPIDILMQLDVPLSSSLSIFNLHPHLQFRHPRPHLGGGRVATPTRLVCPLIEIELRSKDKRKDRDVLNLTIPDLTTLYLRSHFDPGQIKQNMLPFWIKFLATNF